MKQFKRTLVAVSMLGAMSVGMLVLGQKPNDPPPKEPPKIVVARPTPAPTPPKKP